MNNMKLYTNKYIIALLSVSFLLGSCKKSFLEKAPANGLSPTEALSDEAGMQGAVNGIYSDLRAVALYGRDFPILGDLQADNIYVERRNSGRYLPQYNYTQTVNDAVVTEMWQVGYNTILRANQVIDAKVTTSGAASIRAEAYAARGLVYFKLVNIYARPYTDNPDALGVPLVLHYDPYALPGRSKVSEVYAQIVSDLKTALQTAPNYSTSVRLSKYAIEGLLARAYLYMGDYANAKTAAVDVISNSGFSLVSPDNYVAYWHNASARTDKVETLFEVDADVINNNAFDDFSGMYENGYNDMYATSGLVSLYSNTDVRTSVLYLTQTKSGADAIAVDKFPSASSSDRDNIKVMRLSEVYLIAAEAAARTNDEATALNYLNALMAQRDPGMTYSSSGATLINDIVTERRKELAFEGDRLYDLNRLKQNITRTIDPGSIPAPASIPYSDPRRIAPIPQAETQANATLAGEQNPGY
jgi:tetratricopeptide (TPR) repeat protein